MKKRTRFPHRRAEARAHIDECPEQYDVFDGDSPASNPKRVGYLRLRHGEFTAQMPDSEGKTVYYSEPLGDGEFDDSEREIELNLAAWAIRRELLHHA